jgi:hypothetical protein
LAEVEAKIKEVENDRTPGAFFSAYKDPRLKPLEDEKKHLETHLQQLKRVISDCQTAIMKIDLENK